MQLACEIARKQIEENMNRYAKFQKLDKIFQYKSYNNLILIQKNYDVSIDSEQ